MEYIKRKPERIIIFTGLSASGKSTVAERVSQEIGASAISLRQDVLHPVAIENGFARARLWILATCVEPSLLTLERERLVQVINQKSLEADSGSVIVDDLIDPGTPPFLRESFPESQVSVVLIKSNRHLRKRWIIKRTSGTDKEALEEQKWLDGIKIKAGIFKAIVGADFQIRNMGRVEEAVEGVKLFLERGTTR